jgi:hypothetical protein
MVSDRCYIGCKEDNVKLIPTLWDLMTKQRPTSETGRCSHCHEMCEFEYNYEGDYTSLCCGANEIPCDVPERD